MAAERSADPVPEREAEALAEIAATRARPRLAAAWIALFCLLLCAGPALELLRPPPRSGLDKPDVDRVAPDPARLRRAWTVAGFGGVLNEVLDALDRAERRIDRFGAVARLLRGPAQRALLGALDRGNDEVVVGRDGWLFLRTAIEHTVGPGFLSVPAGQVDAATGLIAFQRELDPVGVRLVVLPAPEKEQIHPERLLGETLASTPRNRDFREFESRLRRAGIALFDPAPWLAQSARRGETLYCATDSHWTPRTVDLVADRLAEYLRREIGLPDAPPAGLRRRRTRLDFQGDLERVLGLEPSESPFPRLRLPAQRVLEADGRRFDAAAAESTVLILGDSFSLAYSHQGGRYDSAGLAEQLAFHLDQPVRLIGDVRANSLARRIRWLGQRFSRLGATRVLIYEFAARDLSTQEWTSSREELPRYAGRPLTSRRPRR